MDKISEKDRINEMIGAIMQVARGNFSIRIKLSDKNDDLDSLAMGINMMIEDIESKQKRVTERTNELETSKKQLNEKVTELKQSETATLNIMEDLQETTRKLGRLSQIKSAFLNITSH